MLLRRGVIYGSSKEEQRRSSGKGRATVDRAGGPGEGCTEMETPEKAHRQVCSREFQALLP